MARKIVFLLVLLLGLLLASVSAYATTDTDAAAPDTGLTNDKVSSVDNTGTIQAIDTENTPTDAPVAKDAPVGVPSQAPAGTEPGAPEEEEEDIGYERYISEFLDPASEITDNFLVNIKWNQKDPVNNPLNYVLTGTVKQDSESGSPLIVMLYINADGVYIPLVCVDGTNIIEVSGVAFVSRADLLYLGSDKVNEIRIIAFRKEDADNLIPGVNLQITDKLITAKKTVIIPVLINLDSVLDALKVK
jgi:hypothetical protein